MRNDDDPTIDGLDAADRALVDKVRALAPEGDEPDWKKLEAAIRAEVAPLALPAPWWRTWRWLVPIGALATTAAIVTTFAIRRGESEARKAARMTTTMRDASVSSEAPPLSPATPDRSNDGDERAASMWLDGEPADLDDVGPESLDALDDLPPLAPLDADRPERSAASDELLDEDDDTGATGLLLPAADYQWIDTLRDDEAARLETFLARKRS